MIPVLPGDASNESGSNEIIWPATSSTTTFPGSFKRRIRSVRDAAQMPAHVIATIAIICGTTEPSNKKTPIPTSEPNVPGATGKNPTPHVDIASAM